ncbi:MAG TPA: protein kinase [Polyangiaceae bacterium]|nr:protein kinase [Polyangiaceae bacterium]
MISPSYIELGPLSVPFVEGEIIADKYEFVGLLGSGGVAYVVSALHLELGEMVALKFLRPESLQYEDVVARFASEARAVARIKSEHVAHVYDVGTLPDGAPFIVMEYLEGKDLADILAEHRRLPIQVAVDYVLQACEALACAHAGGIVHRDIKPENLFLSRHAGSAEVIKVLDFGISKSAMAAVGANGRKSAKTMLPMGTPGYMSPEQIRACGTVDARTDIWALGCVLSELITGVTAFDAPTQVQLGALILEREPVPLRSLMPEAPAELEAIVARCLMKDPGERFEDVAELAVALYPFGPRRSRISAERCNQVLRGQGALLEVQSVPPPSGNTSVPASSTGAVVSHVPVALASVDPFRTSAPATLSAIEPARPKRRPGFVAGAAVAVAVLAGAALAVNAAGRGGASQPGAVAAASPVPVTTSHAQPPSGTTAAVQAPTNAGKSTTSPAAPPAATSEPEPTASATGTTRESASPVAARAKKGRPHAAAPKPARDADKPQSAPKRAAVDDAEPDVGY